MSLDLLYETGRVKVQVEPEKQEISLTVPYEDLHLLEDGPGIFGGVAGDVYYRVRKIGSSSHAARILSISPDTLVRLGRREEKGRQVYLNEEMCADLISGKDPSRYFDNEAAGGAWRLHLAVGSLP